MDIKSEHASAPDPSVFAQKRSLLAQLLRKRREPKTYPLSLTQDLLWLLNQLMPESPLFSLPLAIRLTGALRVEALERSLNEIVARHDVLRTTFAVRDGRPVQIVAPALSVPVTVVDLGGLPSAERETRIQEMASEEARRSFNLEEGPLARFTLLRLAADEFIVLFTFHRIIFDGWSLGVFFGELRTLYEAYSTGRDSPLPKLPIQYGDFAIWQRERMQGEVLTDHLAYWRRQLAGAPGTLQLPFDRPRPAIPSFRGARCSLALPKDLMDGLQEMNRREGVTLFMTLLASFQCLLHRWSGQNEIVVGSPASINRDLSETTRLIGLFGNFLVLRTDLGENPTFWELVRQVREVTLGAYAHQDLPLMQLLEQLHDKLDIRTQLPFQVIFALQVYSAPAFELQGVTVDFLDVDSGVSKLDLSLYLWRSDGALAGAFEYSTDRFDAHTIQSLADAYLETLARCVRQPGSRMSSFPSPLKR